MADGGWIKLYRKTRQSFVWIDPNLLKLWMLLLFKASHEGNKFPFNGHQIVVSSGQLVTGSVALASEFNEGMVPDKQVTSRSVWRWVKRFEKEQMLSIKSCSQYSVITINNWGEYQNAVKPVSSERQTSVKPVSTIKNAENAENAKKETTSPAKAEPAVDYGKLFEYLNKKSGKHFRNTPTNQKLVKSRLAEGFTPQDIKAAIDHVCAGWIGTDMARYIQPSTIFRASKFEGYVNSVPGSGSSFSGGKPARKEDNPEWMQPGYTPESKPATPEAKASINAGLDQLKAMRKAKANANTD